MVSSFSFPPFDQNQYKATDILVPKKRGELREEEKKEKRTQKERFSSKFQDGKFAISSGSIR